MCYGMGCMYEDCRGECKCGGINPPSDAACREDEAEEHGDDYYDADGFWENLREMEYEEQRA